MHLETAKGQCVHLKIPNCILVYSTALLYQNVVHCHQAASAVWMCGGDKYVYPTTDSVVLLCMHVTVFAVNIMLCSAVHTLH